MATDHPPVPHASTPPPGGDRDDTGTRRPQLTGIAAQLTQWAAALDDADPMSQMLKETATWVASASQPIEWAEAEIEKASTEHPEYADDLFHAFELLTPTANVMRTEFVYRSHCAELLERVVAGEDTRAPTNAEVAAACSETSLAGPLTTAGFTVYVRAWAAAFPDKLYVLGDDIDSYEHVAGYEADTLERGLRRKLTVQDRTLRNVSCPGDHRGTPTPSCRYFTPEQLGLPLDN